MIDGEDDIPSEDEAIDLSAEANDSAADETADAGDTAEEPVVDEESRAIGAGLALGLVEMFDLPEEDFLKHGQTGQRVQIADTPLVNISDEEGSLGFFLMLIGVLTGRTSFEDMIQNGGITIPRSIVDIAAGVLEGLGMQNVDDNAAVGLIAGVFGGIFDLDMNSLTSSYSRAALAGGEVEIDDILSMLKDTPDEQIPFLATMLQNDLPGLSNMTIDETTTLEDMAQALAAEAYSRLTADTSAWAPPSDENVRQTAEALKGRVDDPNGTLAYNLAAYLEHVHEFLPEETATAEQTAEHDNTAENTEELKTQAPAP